MMAASQSGRLCRYRRTTASAFRACANNRLEGISRTSASTVRRGREGVRRSCSRLDKYCGLRGWPALWCTCTAVCRNDRPWVLRACRRSCPRVCDGMQCGIDALPPNSRAIREPRQSSGGKAGMIHSTDTPCSHALRTKHEGFAARDVASACVWPQALRRGHSMRPHGSQRSCNVWEAHRRQSASRLSRHRSSLYRRQGNGICNRDGENAARGVPQ